MTKTDDDIDQLVADLMDDQSDDTAMLSRAVLTRLASEDRRSWAAPVAEVLTQPTSLVTMFGALFLLTIWLGYALTPGLSPEFWQIQSDLGTILTPTGAK